MSLVQTDDDAGFLLAFSLLAHLVELVMDTKEEEGGKGRCSRLTEVVVRNVESFAQKRRSVPREWNFHVCTKWETRASIGLLRSLVSTSAYGTSK